VATKKIREINVALMNFRELRNLNAVQAADCHVEMRLHFCRAKIIS